MKRILLGANVGLFFGALGAHGLPAMPYQDPVLKAVTNVTHQASLPGALRHLAVENAAGTIHIRGTDTATPGWQWRLQVRSRDEALLQQAANSVVCHTEVNGDSVKLVVTTADSADLRSIESELEITVPKSASVQTRTRNGLTDIAGLTGDVEAINENGPIAIHHVAGNVHAETTGARLAVSDATSATLRNQNGEIEATDINGPLDAKTSFAPVIAENIEGSATLTDHHGDIVASFVRGGLDAGATFGAIKAHDIDGTVQLRDQNGSVDVARANTDPTRVN